MKIKMISVIAVVALISVANIFADAKKSDSELPKFEGDAFVVDTDKVYGYQEDYIKFENLSADYGISFKVYTYDSKTQAWLIWGKTELKGYGDVDTIDSIFSGSLRKYRYFAFVSDNGRHYDFSCAKSHNDLRVTVFDKGKNLESYTTIAEDGSPVVSKSHTKVIDIKSGSGKARDFIKFQNGTDDKDIDFTVSAYDEKSGSWIYIGTSSLGGFGDADVIMSSFSGGLSRFRYFAIESQNEKDYQYTFTKMSHDLLIMVNPSVSTTL